MPDFIISPRIGGTVQLPGGSADAQTARNAAARAEAAQAVIEPLAEQAAAATEGAVETINSLYRGRSMIIDVTLTIPTALVPAGTVLADTQVIADVFREIDAGGYIQSVTIIDRDDVGAAMELEFFDGDVPLGAEGSAPSITDANAGRSMGWMEIGTSDYKDRGGVRVASVKSLAMPIKPIPGTRNLAVAAILGPVAATYPSGTLLVRLGVIQD